MHYVTSTISGPALTPDETAALRRLAAYMIPASVEYGVPGADDESIFGNVLAMLGRETNSVRRGLQRVAELSGDPFGDLAPEAKNVVLLKLAASDLPLLSALITVVVRAYYCDDRVMQSLGMEARPPFPQGFAVEQGDWSLLDPVRARGKVYRDAP